MNFTIITHVPHIHENNIYAYAPYVREMNIWIKDANKVVIVAPIVRLKKTPIVIHYEHENIGFVAIESFDILNLKAIFSTILKIPKNSWYIYSAMKKADHIHLRCPGNIGLLGCFIQILFPEKPKTAKYAGNWDPNSNQPWSYKLQRWILNNTFLTRNMKVLVYGEWKDSSINIHPFYTATYKEEDKEEVIPKIFNNPIRFLFVGTLTSGKRPLYAIQIVEHLASLGYDVRLQLYGEGKESATLQQYCKKNNLNTIIDFKGNQIEPVIRKTYKESHFLLLPSKSEGWPKVVAEAMFWGCIPIVTPVSCVSHMLDYGNRGLLLKMDLEKDVEQIIAILKNQKDYTSKVEKSILWSRKYTLDLFENEINALLHS